MSRRLNVPLLWLTVCQGLFLTNNVTFMAINGLVGLMLAFVRRRTGAIAACIGLHMGWVWVIKSTLAVSREVEPSAYAHLVSRFDGYTGWLVAAWAALLLLLAWRRGWLAPARQVVP